MQGKGAFIIHLMMPLLIKKFSHHALILTSSPAGASKHGGIICRSAKKKLSWKDFLNGGANKARTLPYNQSSLG